MKTTKSKQEKAANYYNKFSCVYDFVSSQTYYREPREYAIEKLELNVNQYILNIPCGTGQNFKYIQEQLKNTGQIVGIDLSKGMLSKASKKIQSYKWNNISLYCEDATKITATWLDKNIETVFRLDAILCDLGLSGFPEWQTVIDSLLSLLKPNGRIVIMDWYMKNPSIRGEIIKWIGKGEVDRPLWQYLESKTSNFQLDDSFKNGDMFVASGNTK